MNKRRPLRPPFFILQFLWRIPNRWFDKLAQQVWTPKAPRRGERRRRESIPWGVHYKQEEAPAASLRIQDFGILTESATIS